MNMFNMSKNKNVKLNEDVKPAHTTLIAISLHDFCEWLCIIGVSTICYYNSINCGLVFDDISAIRDNKDLRSNTPLLNIFTNDFWGTPIRKEQSHKSYRPLTVLTFRANYWIHGLEPFGYHVVNIILHIIVCLMWRSVCRKFLLHCARPARIKTNTFISFPKIKKSEEEVLPRIRGQYSNINYCSFLSSLLFAVHPVHTEAVTGVVGRAELLSSIFYLSTFLIYVRSVSLPMKRLPTSRFTSLKRTRWLFLFIAFTASLSCAMLSKEQGITVAAICIIYEIFIVQKLSLLNMWLFVSNLFCERKLFITNSPFSTLSFSQIWMLRNENCQWNMRVLVKRLGFLVFIASLLIFCRISIMGSQLPVFTRFDNPASAAETPQRQLTYAYILYVNTALLFFPCILCCDWTMNTIPLIYNFRDTRNLKTVCTIAGIIAIIVKACRSRNPQQSRVLVMCLAWTILPFIPASNIFFPVGFVVAERILYMPSLGFSLLVAKGYLQAQKYLHRKKYYGTILHGLLLCLLVSHALKTYNRNIDWQTEYSLFMSGIHVNHRNAKLFNNVGHALENEKRHEEALLYFQKAAIIQPDDIGAHVNVGRAYSNLKMYNEAEVAYTKAKNLFPKFRRGESYQARIAPNHLNVFINLANLISKNQSRLEEADYLYRQAIGMRVDYVQAYINRGDILMKLNRTNEAQKAYEMALVYDSDNADIYYNLGVVFLEQGKPTQANVHFNKAIELHPDHEQALLNSAILLQEIGGETERQLSRERLYKILSRDTNNERAYFHLGMLAMDELNIKEAERFFKQAIHINPKFRSALFNLALLLSDANQTLDALPYLNQLIHHHPDHIKGLILLGDIYINHIRDLDTAELCYRNILKYEPHNVEAVHNLCVVFVERKQLAKAESCLKYANYLAPEKDYIVRHLEIVQTRLWNIEKKSSHLLTIQNLFFKDEFKIPFFNTQNKGKTSDKITSDNIKRVNDNTPEQNSN